MKSKYRRKYNKLQIKHEIILRNYFYNLYMNSQEAEGIDKETLEYRLRLYWNEGKAAAYKLKVTEDVAYAPFAQAGGFNHNGVPTKCYLVDEFGVGRAIIPYGPQVVNKDVVLCYALKSKRPIKEVIDYQVSRISAVRRAINQNLHINMIPYLIKSTNNDNRIKDIFDRIFAGEEYVSVAPEDIAYLEDALQLNAPYIIDKLQAYEKDLMNETLTFLGINNMGTQEKKERMITGELESNNELISIFGECFMREAKIESEKIKEVLGKDVTFKDTTPQFMIEKEVGEKEDEADE